MRGSSAIHYEINMNTIYMYLLLWTVVCLLFPFSLSLSVFVLVECREIVEFCAKPFLPSCLVKL